MWKVFKNLLLPMCQNASVCGKQLHLHFQQKTLVHFYSYTMPLVDLLHGNQFWPWRGHQYFPELWPISRKAYLCLISHNQHLNPFPQTTNLQQKKNVLSKIWKLSLNEKKSYWRKLKTLWQKENCSLWAISHFASMYWKPSAAEHHGESHHYHF